MLNVTIDLGGTRTKVGVIKNNSVVGYSIEKSSSKDSFSISISNLTEQIKKLLADNSINENKVDGIGLAFPGLVNVKENKVISTNEKYKQALGFDFCKWANKYWRASFRIENDARAAIIGEWQYGVGKEIDNIAMMTIGTGIGSAIILNGRILYGKHFQAGILGGHFTTNYNGDKCNCGNIGCVESEASTWKLNELIKSNKSFKKSILSKTEIFNFKILFNAARKNDEVAIEVMNHSLKVWATGVVNLIHAYDPEIVILHGGVMKSADIITPFIQEYVNKHAWLPLGEVKIVESSSTDFAALWGMNYLCNVSNTGRKIIGKNEQ